MKISMQEQFVLPADVELVPVSDLPLALRERLQFAQHHIAVMRPRGRAAVKLVDAVFAELLGHFREHSTIPQAFAKALRRDPSSEEMLLKDAYPLLRQFVSAGFLVGAQTGRAEVIDFALRRGDLIGRWNVRQCLKALDDTETYIVSADEHDRAFLKILRDPNMQIQDALAREAAVLKYAPHGIAPSLIEDRSEDEQPYIVCEYLSGIPLHLRAAQLRRKGETGLTELAALAAEFVEKFAGLHGAGILHGDVHGGNFLYCSGEVRLVDFGNSAVESLSIEQTEMRRGVPVYMEPEWARALLAGGAAPQANYRSEVYSVGLVIYQLLTGALPFEEKLERGELMKEIAGFERPAIVATGNHEWNQASAVFLSAMADDPVDRFADAREFSSRLRNALAADLVEIDVNSPPASVGPALFDCMVALARSELTLDEPQLERPSCSIVHGAAGIALGLRQVACAVDAPDLHSLAEQWLAKAFKIAEDPDVFYFEDMTLGLIGTSTPYHCRPGLELVRAILAADLGDTLTWRTAADEYARLSSDPSPKQDLTLGTAGALLGAAVIGASRPHALDAMPQSVREAGDGLADQLEDWLAGRPTLNEDQELQRLGIAHGLSGIIYALLAWSEVSGRQPLEMLVERLRQLASEGIRTKTSIRWPQFTEGSEKFEFVPSWCNGNGGLIEMWLIAARVTGREEFAEIAILTGQNVCEEVSAANSICCGIAGQAYGLLSLYHHTGDRIWVERAHALCQIARSRIGEPTSLGNLYKSWVGVAVLEADLGRPEFAAMPLFGLPRQRPIFKSIGENVYRLARG
ncbi:MAG: lanthionine synthetase LanC family protein [Novosphingobium sp.]